MTQEKPKYVADLKSLKEPEEPYDIVIGGPDEELHFIFTVRPRNAFDYGLARVTAQNFISRIESSAWDLYAIGFLPKERAIDLGNQQTRDVIYEQFFMTEMAVSHITQWGGHSIGDLQLTEDHVRAVMALWPVSASGHNLLPYPLRKVFYERLMGPRQEIELAKKESGAAPAGTSSRTPAPHTAPAA